MSSSSPIIIGADKEISPSAGQTFVATVWNTSSLPANGPYEVTGTALSALTSYSAALYAVASGGATMVGTKFGTSGTTGFTVTSSSTITNFSSTTNSYGIGLGGAGGANLATGWATNSSLNCPCFYVISPPTGTTGGLYYFSASAGVASTVSSPTGGSGAVLNLYEAGAAGSIGSSAAAWSVTYSRSSKSSPFSGPTVTAYTGLPSSGAAFSIVPTYDTANVSSGNSLGGIDNTAIEGFNYTCGLGTYAGSYSDIGEDSITGIYTSTRYVGQVGGAAYVNFEYSTYGTLYNWLSNYNWGVTVPLNAFGIGNFESLDTAYALVSWPTNLAGCYYVVGTGTSTTGQMGYLAAFQQE